MAVINSHTVFNPIPLTRASIYLVPTTIAAKDTLRIAVPLQGATTAHFANATISVNNINISLTSKSSVNSVYVFITNNSSNSITLTSSTLTVAIHP